MAVRVHVAPKEGSNSSLGDFLRGARKAVVAFFLGPLFEDFTKTIITKYEGQGQEKTAKNAALWYRRLGRVFNGRRVKNLNSDMFYLEFVPYARKQWPGRKLNEEKKFYVKLLNAAWERRLVERPPGRIPMPDIQGTGRAPSDHEVAVSHAACDDEKYQFQMEIKLTTGMRPGEVLKLRWSWFAFDVKGVRFPAWATKTKQERTVYFTDFVWDKLMKMYPDRVSDCVFPALRDPNKPQTVFNRKAQARMRKVTGVSFRDYDLRHYAATKMVKLGHDRENVGIAIGTSQEMLRKHYVHVDKEDIRRVATAVDIPQRKQS